MCAERCEPRRGLLMTYDFIVLRLVSKTNLAFADVPRVIYSLTVKGFFLQSPSWGPGL